MCSLSVAPLALKTESLDRKVKVYLNHDSAVILGANVSSAIGTVQTDVGNGKSTIDTSCLAGHQWLQWVLSTLQSL